MKNYTTSVNFPIGTGGYTYCWTDKYPVTLVEVLSPSRVVVQDANATIISGSAQDGSVVALSINTNLIPKDLKRYTLFVRVRMD